MNPNSSQRNFLFIILLITVYYSEASAQSNFDSTLFRNINNNRSVFADNIFSFTNDVVPYIAIGVPVAIGIYGIAEGKKYEENSAFLLILSSGVNLLITEILKSSFQRTRPYAVLNDVNLLGKKLDDNRSMPSEHSSSTFAIATMLSLHYKYWYVIIPSFTLAGLTAYGRVYSGVHYPTDVLVGAIIGIGVAFLVNSFDEELIAVKDKIFETVFGRTSKNAAITPYYNGNSFGVSISWSF